MPIRLRRYFLRDAAAFTSPDPWTGQGLADYVLAEYVVAAANLPHGEPLRPDHLAVRLMERRYAIRTKAGKPRFLPQSLVELWKGGEASLEELPGLLAGMEASLRKPSDYYESRYAWFNRWANLALAAIASAGLLAWLAQMMRAGSYSDFGTWSLLACGALAFCGTTEFVCGRPARRRKWQKRWAIQQIRQRGTVPVAEGGSRHP